MWLIPRSLASAQASECLTKESAPASVISEGEAEFWVTSSGTPTLRQSSWRGWQARRWSRHLFGQETLRLCDGNSLLTQWTSSARDSRANRTPWPAAEKEPMTTAGFGRQFVNAFAWFDPDSSTWKTSPGCDLLGEWLPYSQTWPRSGSVSNGTACERPTWAPPTSGNGFSSWPTARSTDGTKGRPNQRGSSGDLMLTSAAAQWCTPKSSESEHPGRTTDSGHQATLGVMANNWETPMSSDTGDKVTAASKIGLIPQVAKWATPDCNTSTRSNGLMGPNIREQAMNWPTPDVCSASRDMSKIDPERQNTANGKVTIGLPTIAESWPTPSAAVTNLTESPESWQERADKLKEKHGNGNGAGMPLTVAASVWPTPASRDQKGENSLVHILRTDGRTDGRLQHIDQLPNFVMFHFSHQDQTMTDGQQSLQQGPTSRRRLNAQFVDWLMGWQPGWTNTEPTACGAEEMELYRSKLDFHLSSLLGAPEFKEAA